MACPPERYANLPIAPKYKNALVAFCSSPENAGACDQLCKASDEEIVATIEKIAPQLDQWEQNGVPDEIRNASPELANELSSQPSMDNNTTSQGIGSLSPPPPPSSIDPSIPPGQLADVPMPMDRPASPPRSNVSYRNGGFVNAPSYGIGGLFKGVSNLFGGEGGLLGGLIGGALAFFTGGMSLAAGAALGSAAGTFADTGDLGLAARSAIGAYGLGTGVSGALGSTAAKASAASMAPQVGVPGSVNGVSNMGATGRSMSNAITSGTSAVPNDFFKVAKVASKLTSQPNQGVQNQAPVTPMPIAPAPVQMNTGPIKIPGADLNRQVKTSNPQLNEGLGGLAKPYQNIPIYSQQNTMPAPAPAPAPIPDPSLTAYQFNDPLAGIDPEEMAAYYECVAEHGADMCQMPDQMLDQTNSMTMPIDYPQSYAEGGNVNAINMQNGGAVHGIGTETSDSQPAWLSDNEFVMTADAVRGMGNGDIDEGANRMYQMMAQLEQRG